MHVEIPRNVVDWLDLNEKRSRERSPHRGHRQSSVISHHKFTIIHKGLVISHQYHLSCLNRVSSTARYETDDDDSFFRCQYGTIHMYLSS